MSAFVSRPGICGDGSIAKRMGTRTKANPCVTYITLWRGCRSAVIGRTQDKRKSPDAISCNESSWLCSAVNHMQVVVLHGMRGQGARAACLPMRCCARSSWGSFCMATTASSRASFASLTCAPAHGLKPLHDRLSLCSPPHRIR